MTDYRSELQALVDACESFADPISGHRIPWQTALDRARAALSEREPEGPTDIELLSMAGTAIGHEIEFGEYEPETECAVEAYGSELIDFARAVLARWGNNTSRSN